MGRYTRALRHLSDTVLEPNQVALIRGLLSAEQFSIDEFVTIDRSIGGPSVDMIEEMGSGCYDPSDRDVFRPLQYCKEYFNMFANGRSVEWLTRDAVQKSALHLETLVKRVGRLGRVPLGKALSKAIVQRQLGPVVLSQIREIARIFNASKHEVDHPKDTHLFSVEDATIAYFVCRKLGNSLMPLCALRTSADVFCR